ncbi:MULTISPECIES: 16S rRNA (cytosine(1402)-N(4))-methyltransferase RsmH [unclassified Iodidimonas]|jgi:16S rRNA (cytosine1402-N4)-methyltransferase|uniref:16S rRNA (cytosine(1402)-N(4))-methyltransferase RsmH n=1 Tax=unclassified Iodidimonas TaxID=2626145 RepID=UPI00248261F2|nr:MULTISPECIES: 16S rRNA (cytosine(1402)-N(4))-methyltransferase RsmH [unclassified Iodidimonas]
MSKAARKIPGRAKPHHGHVPVMCDAVIDALVPTHQPLPAHARFVDGTFGAGGYSRALLDRSPQITVYAIDRDPEAIARGAEMLRAYEGRFRLLEGRFSEMEALLRDLDVHKLAGITLDIGVSSYQLETAARGFSFQLDGPLDMRMGGEGPSAADLVNGKSEEELADIIYHLGEDPRARKIARALVAARAETPITTTLQLAEIIAATVGHGPHGKKKIHPATRSFQALRIAVNDELGELSRVLCAAERLLAPEGRLAIVAFHSLEDRIVKAFLAERAGRLPAGSRHRPAVPDDHPAPSFYLPKKGAIKPTAQEISSNPRARSARLRVAVRTDAPAWKDAA